MTIEDGKHFINLKDIVGSRPTPSGKIGFEFGASPISIISKETSKSARRADRHISGMVHAGIFDQDVKTEDFALVHDFNNSTFIRVVHPQGRDWFIHPRVLVNKNEKIDYINEFPACDVQEMMQQGTIHVASGTCMFGILGAHVYDGQGNKFSLTDPTGVEEIKSKVMGLEINHNLHPFEADSILRISNFMTSLNPHIQVELDFHIPRLEYWLYGLTLYERGLMEADTLIEWFNEVNQRSLNIEKLVRRRMPANVRMNIACPLSPIEGYLFDAVKANGHHIQAGVFEILAEKNDFWKFATSNGFQEENTFTHLNYQSYVQTYLDGLKQGKGLLLVVENPEEIAILDNTKKTIDTMKEIGMPLDSGVIIGLFIHPNILVPEGGAKDDKKVLYFSKDLSIGGLKEVIYSHR